MLSGSTPVQAGCESMLVAQCELMVSQWGTRAGIE